MTDLTWHNLITVAGLHGLIPCYEQAGKWLRLDRDYALRLPPGGPTLTAHLRSSEHARLRLELNAYEGVRVREVPGCDGTPRFHEFGNRFELEVQPGEFTLTFERFAKCDATGFSARLCRDDGSPADGIESRLEVALDLPPVWQLAWDSLRHKMPDPSAMPSPYFSPWHYFNEKMNQPGELAFTAGTDWPSWQPALRAKLTELAAEPGRVPLQPIVQPLPFDEPGIQRYVVLFRSEPNSAVIAHLLVPERPNGAGLLCLHGHGYKYGETLGLYGGDRAQQRLMEQANYAYTLEAARRGYVALTPELRGFGDRADPPRPPKDMCDANFFRATHFGQTLVGLNLCDLRAALDVLQSRPEVDPDRLGCLGLSTGGRMTMYLSALDDRIKVAVPSGCLNTFAERLSIGSSCGTQFLPGLLNICDTPEIFGLIAPRPLLIEHGADDGTSPELYAMHAYERLRTIYRAAGAGERLALDIFPGGHRWNGQAAWEWLERWL
jgi:dienelactone hydrolase